jgi:hypothetical protein
LLTQGIPGVVKAWGHKACHKAEQEVQSVQTRRVVMHKLLALCCLLAFFSAVASANPYEGLVINEVYYDAEGADEPNEFVELFNNSDSVIYLDGLVITDEGLYGTEGAFIFPGILGSTTDYPIYPNEFVVIAVDAQDDGIEPELGSADWECYQGPSDYDNPSVPNLVRIGGNLDMALSNSGDGIAIGDSLPIGAPTKADVGVVDGVNYESPTDPVEIGPGITDAAFHPGVSTGESIGRCLDGVDRNISSAEDFYPMMPTPGGPNDCPVSAEPCTWGSLKAIFGRR